MLPIKRRGGDVPDPFFNGQLVANHLHVLLGCDVADAPRDVALSLMNNLAYAHGMKRVYESSFYVGTFGPYDHGAIRPPLKDQGL